MNFLEEILESKKTEVSKLKKGFSLSSFKEMGLFEKKTISIINSLRKANRLFLIAEIKKASPSKGVLIDDFNHLKIANIYLENNADAISVLTDVINFKGSQEYLKEIAAISDVPLLRKDFIIDEHQVFESKAIGSDFILLICEMLSKNQIKDLTHAAMELGMEVLLELHSENQLDKIDYSLNKLIGINNRDLHTFETDLSTTKNIAGKLPEDVFIVSESGIHLKDDIEFLKDLNINAVLVGEHFMRSENIGASLKQMKEWCSNES